MSGGRKVKKLNFVPRRNAHLNHRKCERRNKKNGDRQKHEGRGMLLRGRPTCFKGIKKRNDAFAVKAIQYEVR